MKLSDRMRATYNAWNSPPSEGLPTDAGIVNESADVIDALAEALELAMDELDRISTHGGYGTYAGVDEKLTAALTLARKER